jgi:AcrR family transcriptional regulator
MSSQVPAASPTRRSQADRSAATRDALVAAARPLFAAHGFAEVSTDAIAAAAGVTRGALYHQFADKTALFEAVLAAVEADIARRLAEAAVAAGISDPVEALQHAVRTWLDICVEPEILRIALVDGPSVLGWTHWREVCYLHVLGLVRALLAQGIELGRIRAQPVVPLAHVFMGAGDEAALYVAEATDRTKARIEMTGILDQLIQGLIA